MIDEGLVALIQSGITLQSNPPLAPGGFAVQLPENLIGAPGQPGTYTMAWTFRSIISDPTIVLEGQDPFTSLEIQIDCHGYTMAYARLLARAIMRALPIGYAGTLTDADSTVVAGIFRLAPFIDGFSDADRSFVRSLEYKINYYETA
jgi:hypothetical protein